MNDPRGAPSASRLVHLVRHGETEGESSIRFHGRNDVRLDDVGREQIRRLIPWLVEPRFTAVVHSPLSRAAESTRLLVGGFSSPPPVVEAHQGLTEVHFPPGVIPLLRVCRGLRTVIVTVSVAIDGTVGLAPPIDADLRGISGERQVSLLLKDLCKNLDLRER